MNPGSPDSIAPSARYHLLMKPESGGIPTSARPATVKHRIVAGMIRPIPFSSETDFFPVCTIIAPAHKKRRFLMTEWNTTCIKAPVSAVPDKR